MKWTLQVLYSQILLIVLCLSFPSPDIQAAGTDRRSRDTYQTKTSSDKITDKVTGKITTADGEPLAHVQNPVFEKLKKLSYLS